MERTITVEFSGSVDLNLDQVWPDGDAPAEITAEAVAEVMRRDGSKSTVLDRWDLDDCVEVRVFVDGGDGVEVWA